MQKFDIYEEGFCVMECSANAHYIGSAYGHNFLDACKNFIKETGRGYVRKFEDKEFACDWGCRWFPTLAEAQKSFG